MENKRTYKTIEVDGAWIENNIIKPGWQRNLYPSRVNHFINHIRNKTFDKSLITVAREMDTGKLILLDGQHKIEALRVSNEKLEMDVCIHDGLDEEGMIRIYRMLNNVKQPRLIDDIKIYLGKTEWLDCYLDKFPINVSLSGGVNSIRVDKFLNIISNSKLKETNRRNLNRKNINEFIESLDETTYHTMAGFCSLYKDCFGEPGKDNWLYKNILVFTLCRIWLKNKTLFKQREIQTAFSLIEGNESIRRDLFSVDKYSIEALTRKIYSIINRKRSINLFLPFWEEQFNLNN